MHPCPSRPWVGKPDGQKGNLFSGRDPHLTLRFPFVCPSLFPWIKPSELRSIGLVVAHRFGASVHGLEGFLDVMHQPFLLKHKFGNLF